MTTPFPRTFLFCAGFFLGGPLLLHSQTAATLTVSSHMDPYRAGGYDDESDGIPPAVYSFVAGSARFHYISQRQRQMELHVRSCGVWSRWLGQFRYLWRQPDDR